MRAVQRVLPADARHQDVTICPGARFSLNRLRFLYPDAMPNELPIEFRVKRLKL